MNTKRAVGLLSLIAVGFIIACGSDVDRASMNVPAESCTGIPADPPADIDWSGSGPESELQLCIQVEKTNYGAGESVDLTGTVTNRSDEIVQLWLGVPPGFPRTPRMIFYRVTDENGQTVADNFGTSDFGLTSVLTGYHWDPGEKVTRSVTWDQTDNSGSKVPDGRYWITALYAVMWNASEPTSFEGVAATPRLEISIG